MSRATTPTARQRAATSQVRLPLAGSAGTPPPPPTSTRRGLIVAGALIVVAAVVAAGVLLLRPPTTPTPPVGGPTAAQRELLAVLPIGFAATNCTPAPDREDAAVDAAVTCTDGPSTGPGTAVFLRYRDADELATAHAADQSDRGVPGGDATACRKGDPTSGTWARGNEAGLLSCYDEAATGATIDWTDPRVRARAIVTRSDGDAAVLYDWWSAGGFL